jgi:hypothetical protein
MHTLTNSTTSLQESHQISLAVYLRYKVLIMTVAIKPKPQPENAVKPWSTIDGGKQPTIRVQSWS